MATELKPCPFCGAEVEINGGPEEWAPTWWDPDSGGDPYFIACKCGITLMVGYCEPQEIEKAWNRRAEIEV